MAVSKNTEISPADMASLATLANTKSSLSGTPYSFADTDIVTANPLWLTELNRLLLDVDAALYTAFGSNLPYKIISQSPKIPMNNPAGNYFTAFYPGEWDFFYSDTGSAETATISQDTGSVQLVNESSGATFYVTLTIGGTDNVTLSGEINARGSILSGDFTNPIGHTTYSTTFGSTSGFEYNYVVGASISFKIVIPSQTLAPGDYTASITFGGPVFTGCDGNCDLILSVQYGPASDDYGINSSASVKKITGSRESSGKSFGAYQGDNQLNPGTVALQSSVDGYFVSKHLQEDLNNKICCRLSNESFYGELMPWDKPILIWQPGFSVSVGRTIIDSNGNTQTVSGAGRTGQTEPTWATATSGTTSDGTCTWTNGGAAYLAGSLAMCPRYPYAKSDNLTAVIPGSAPSSPQGWFINGVQINRNSSGSPISVELGCIRSGSFTSFGTYATGDYVDCMWPVFTSDALIYVASEVVDIQASVCNMAPNTYGPIAGKYYPLYPNYLACYPVHAHVYNWLEQMFGLLT